MEFGAGEFMCFFPAFIFLRGAEKLDKASCYSLRRLGFPGLELEGGGRRVDCGSTAQVMLCFFDVVPEPKTLNPKP